MTAFIQFVFLPAPWRVIGDAVFRNEGQALLLDDAAVVRREEHQCSLREFLCFDCRQNLADACVKLFDHALHHRLHRTGGVRPQFANGVLVSVAGNAVCFVGCRLPGKMDRGV